MKAVALALVLLAPAVVHAQEVDPAARARELVAVAQRHFDLGEYETAIVAYSEAYRIDPRPGLLFNLAQAHRLSGDCVQATVLYRNYLRVEPRSKYRALVEQHLANMEACVADRTRPKERESEPERVAPPPPAAPPAPAEPIGLDVPPPPSGRGRTLRTAGLATIGGGLVVAAVGAYFAVDATRAADEVSAAYATGATWDDVASIDARGQRSELVGAVGLAVGGAAIATGATLYALGVRSERAPATTIAPSRGGGTMVMTWTF